MENIVSNLNRAFDLLQNEEFVNELEKINNRAQAREIFASKGAELSNDEFASFTLTLKQAAGMELSESELELVTGGGALGDGRGESLRKIINTIGDWLKKL